MPFKNKQSFLTITIVALLAGGLIIIGCGEENDERINLLPVINKLNVPEQVYVGDSVEFQVFAYDDDGDLLTYKWEVEEGQLSSDTEQTVIWTSPAVEGSVTVKVIVNDGVNHSIVKSKTITVSKPPKPYKVELKLDIDQLTLDGFIMGHPIFTWKNLMEITYKFQCDSNEKIEVDYPGYIEVEKVNENELNFTFSEGKKGWGLHPKVTNTIGDKFRWGSFSKGVLYEDGRARIGVSISHN